MTLQRQAVNINFAGGLDTKTDPYQVQLGKFLSLENSIFLKGGLLTKRNGYGSLSSLPNDQSTYVCTFNGELTAIGDELSVYSSNTNTWIDRGNIQPASLGTLPLVRNNTNQSQVDSIIAPNGLICTVFADQNPSNLSTLVFKYTIADSETGQVFVNPTLLPNQDPTYGYPRVFLVGNYFVIVYSTLISSVSYLEYIAIGTQNPTMVSSPAVISSSYTPSATIAFDGIVYSGHLYLFWNTGSGVNALYLTANLAFSSTVVIDSSHPAEIFAANADSSNGIIWVSYYNTGSQDLYTAAINTQLNSILAPTLILSSVPILNLALVASSGLATHYYEVSNNYPYDSSVPTHFINIITITQGGSFGSPTGFLRSVGLASKAVLLDGIAYFLVAYKSPYQSTYFLVNAHANIVGQLAYGNGNGYLTHGLPGISVYGAELSIPYLFADLIQAVNKNTNVPSGSQVEGVYSQFGINLATFNIDMNSVYSAEIGSNLNISAGFLWGYDGNIATEQGFFLWPDSVEVSTSPTDGNLSAQTYFYQVTYEWTDSQGNAFRSAPSVPVSVTTTGTTSQNILSIPTLRLTYKIANPVKIVIYRWSQAQPIYYQVTSIQQPILNSLSVDYIVYGDPLADSSILGNNILYTTGGVLENIGGPAFENVFTFDNRLWGISSEDRNLLWYSKQVLEQTSVEMSDLLTIYVAPTLGAQGSTGPITCGFPMDDKAIIFKASGIFYIAGTGPDITGANNQYSEPIFITSTVGCSNQDSIVSTPLGLMFEFQSSSGNQIWLLGRDLSTLYIGAEVESLTSNATVLSSVNIPGANQVRFIMDSGITLMYDYFYQKWGTFTDIPAISSTIFQGLHTYINHLGQVFQETPGVYLDGDSPVLMSFQTSWIQMGGLQGYQKADWFTLLGTYYSPHKLSIQVGYDYNPNFRSSTIIEPTNFNPTWGGELNWGSGQTWGGNVSLEQWRIFFQQKRCQAVQVSLQEMYDPSYGVPAGQGLSISGLNFIIAVKSGTRPFRASHSMGAQ